MIIFRQPFMGLHKGQELVTVGNLLLYDYTAQWLFQKL
jgi:hypothetical protein